MNAPTIRLLDPASIRIPDDAPPVHPDHVARLVRSLSEVGQLAPIVVTTDLSLVDGRGRLEAQVALKQPVLAMLLDNASAAKIGVARADADLTHADTPHLQVAMHTFAHEVWLKETGQRAGPGRKGVTTKDMAARIGKNVRDTNRYLQVGRSLAPDVRAPLLAHPRASEWSLATLLRLAALPHGTQADVTRRIEAAPLTDVLDAVAPVPVKARSREAVLGSLRKRLASAEQDAEAVAGVPGMEAIQADLEALILKVDAVIAALEEADEEVVPEAAPEPAEVVREDAPLPPEPEVGRVPSAAAPLVRGLAEAVDTVMLARSVGPAPAGARRQWTGPAAAFAVPLGVPLGLDVRVDGDRAEARGPTDALRWLDRLLALVPPDPPPSLRGELRRVVASREGGLGGSE
ncbi:MAG: hypothetical protein ACI8PZ_002119 [Myxococcota bacterium]|jgi:hypothetical protein